MSKILAIRLFSISILVLILLLSISNSASADGSQSWYLTRNPAGIHANDGTWHSCDNIMRKAEPEFRSLRMELIGEIGHLSRVAWWYSDEMAQTDVTFGENNWSIDLYYTNTFGSGVLQAQVWSVDINGFLERLLTGGEARVYKRTGYRLKIECRDNEISEQTVLKDHRLALKISYDPDQWVDGVLLFYGSDHAPAYMKSPVTDPGFPLPELPAIALLAGGLCCLGVYVVFIHRREKRPQRIKNHLDK